MSISGQVRTTNGPISILTRGIGFNESVLSSATYTTVTLTSNVGSLSTIGNQMTNISSNDGHFILQSSNTSGPSSAVLMDITAPLSISASKDMSFDAVKLIVRGSFRVPYGTGGRFVL